MNFRQYKKILKELKAFAELKQKRLLDEYNYNIPAMWRYKEYKRIIALQKIFYRNSPFKYLRRIEKYEKAKAKRIIEHQERNKRFYFRGAKNLCVGVIE